MIHPLSICKKKKLKKSSAIVTAVYCLPTIHHTITAMSFPLKTQAQIPQPHLAACPPLTHLTDLEDLRSFSIVFPFLNRFQDTWLSTLSSAQDDQGMVLVQ